MSVRRGYLQVSEERIGMSLLEFCDVCGIGQLTADLDIFREKFKTCL
jgi:hypothetical protein